MKHYKTLEALPDIKGKTVLLRVDLNVPVQHKKVSDLTRIKRLKPTINSLIAKGANILILSHFGRPKGHESQELSLSFLPPLLSEVWGHDVGFKEKTSQITLLENTRFHAGEEKNDPELAKQWASMADIYVNDAFSVSHRAHASTEAITHFLPSYAGHLMDQEIQMLTAALEKPQKPVTALVGGSKISTKIGLLGNLIKKVDVLILGGAMANTFIAAEGYDVGKSLCEHDMLETARNIMKQAKENNCTIILPKDCVVAERFEPHAEHTIVSISEIPAHTMALDLGPQSMEQIKSIIDQSKTLLWNGPLGAFETLPFDHATVELAQYVAQKTKDKEIISIAGGGDTVSALAHSGVKNKFTYVSSAGGAFLEWIEGKDLPGIKALSLQQST